MYEITQDMGFREEAIYLAIVDLLKREERITQEDIATRLKCSIPTVSRGCVRLLRAGRITRTGNPRTGYQYAAVPELSTVDRATQITK